MIPALVQLRRRQLEREAKMARTALKIATEHYRGVIHDRADARLEADLATARAGAAACLAEVLAAEGYRERRIECAALHKIRSAGWRPLADGTWRGPDGQTAGTLSAADRHSRGHR